MKYLGPIAIAALFSALWWAEPAPRTVAGSPPAATGSVGVAAPPGAVPPRTGQPLLVREATTSALKARIAALMAQSSGDLLEAARTACEALALPDHSTWFRATFGEEIGARLTTEYAPWTTRFRTLPDLLANLSSNGQTEILVERHDGAADLRATGYQSVALAAMERPVPLYSVRMLVPGEKSGYSLWSFVHVDGDFRFAGKMRAVQPEERSRDTAMLGELRRSDARHFLETGNFPGDE